MPRLVDLFCGAGGCAVGYARAGFDVVGVDNRPQKNYPFEFVQADALEYLARHGHEFDAIHASPPCQAYSATERIRGNKSDHPELVGQVRELLEAVGKMWVIENVPGSPLVRPAILCGTQFGLRVRRHRLFESNVFLFMPANPCTHRDGDLTVFGDVAQVCGTFAKSYQDKTGRTHWRKKRIPAKKHGGEAMGIDWMSGRELSQAIPPAYTHFVGKQLMAYLEGIHVSSR